MGVSLLLGADTEADLILDPGDDARARERSEDLVRAVVVIVAVDKEVIDAHLPVICDPLDEIESFVANGRNNACASPGQYGAPCEGTCRVRKRRKLVLTEKG